MARRAPAASASNFAHTTVGWISGSVLANEAKPQSLPAMTFSLPLLLLQYDDYGGGGGLLGALGGGICSLLYLALIVVVIAGMWKAFEKAGQPGWTAIVPILNIIVMLKIADKELWWIVLMLIPLVNIVIAIIVMIAIAEKFGKSAGFGIGLALLGFIFWPILGFGDAQYHGTPDPIF